LRNSRRFILEIFFAQKALPAGALSASG
jgi:hypothetical protein